MAVWTPGIRPLFRAGLLLVLLLLPALAALPAASADPESEERTACEPASDLERLAPILGLRRALYPVWVGEEERRLAVDRGLAWLAAHQSDDGRWESAGFGGWCDGGASGHVLTGAGERVYDVGITGLALLAFQAAGYVPGGGGPHGNAYGQNVAKGLDYLVSVQDAEGCIGPRTTMHYVYSHAYAAQALVEAYALVDSTRSRRAAQKALDFSRLAQNPHYGWRYGVKPGDNDTSVTAVMLLPFVVAARLNAVRERAGSAPPLDVDGEVFEWAFAWSSKMVGNGRVGYIQRGGVSSRAQAVVNAFPARRTESTTALATVCWLLSPVPPRGTDDPEAGMRLMVRRPPLWRPKTGNIDLYYWYYAALAFHQVGGPEHQRWRQALGEALLPTQRSDGDRCGYLGSWDPVGAWGSVGGRVYATAIGVLSLLAESRFPRYRSLEIEAAQAELETLRGLVKEREVVPAVMLDQLVTVADAYFGMQPPPAPKKVSVPSDLPERERTRREKEAQADHDRAVARYEKALAALPKVRDKYRASAEKLFLKAFSARRVQDAKEGNVHLSANLLAARLLGLMGSDGVSAPMRSAFEKKFLKARYEVPRLQYEEAFGALARLGDPASLRWLARKAIGTKRSTACDEARAGSALRAMRAFPHAPGETRHRVFQALLEVYGPLEGSCEPGLLDEVAATLRHLAGKAPDAREPVPASLRDHAAWLLEHDDPAAPPWQDD